jgi:hypothetical protein
MIQIWTPTAHASRSLGVLLTVIALAGCAGAATARPSPTPYPSPTPVASITAPSQEPTVTPMPTLRTAWDIPPFAELVKMFDYDTAQALGYNVSYEERQEGATISDVSYRSGDHTVTAKLVMPDGKGPFPAVLYAHGMGLAPSFFLPEMLVLARQGYAGLAIDGPEGRAPYAQFYLFDAPKEIAGHVVYVTDLRRAIDLLGTLPRIDATRLGFAGHSLGCKMGGILSGVDDRIDAYVLMSCAAYDSDPTWGNPPIVGIAPEEEVARYLDQMAVLNPANYVSHNKGAAFFVQGDKGDWEPNQQALYQVAPEPKMITWYEGGHSFGCKTWGACNPALPAFADHRAWLMEHV